MRIGTTVRDVGQGFGRFTLGTIWIGLSAWAAAQELGPAPEATIDDFVAVPPRLSLAAVAVNPANRADVVRFYQTTYLASESVAPGWTGNTATCSAGTTSANYANATVLRVNYYRAMAGLPGDVTLSNAWCLKAQKAALMMAAQGSLSHSPGTTWACYSAEGKEAAGKSNLALGADGPTAVDLYMDDFGANNAAVGHRRWVLFPPTKLMGTGSVPGGGSWPANDLWVIGGAGQRPAQPAWVAWPPKGYVPWQILPQGSSRWSFSHAGAILTNAQVRMTCAGTNVPVALEAQAQGYGDNTLVWRPNSMPAAPPATDLKYTVTVSQVKVSGQAKSFSYDVIVIDPDKPALAVRRDTGGNLVITWPTANPNYVLQQNLNPTNKAAWKNVPTPPQISGGQYRVTLPPSPGLQFFRLVK